MTYKLSRWSLDDLYPGMKSPELENAFDQVDEQVTTFEGVRGKLRADMSVGEFLHVVKTSEEMARIVNKLDAFAGLAFAADTQNQAAQTLQNRVQQFMAEMANRTLFFSLWWKELDEANAKRLMDASGDYVRVTGGDAVIVAGGYPSTPSDYGLITTCIEGRVIIQTFSDHDYHREDIQALWENYVTYVLTNHFAVVP